MADIKYDILEELGVLSESAKGWKKERSEERRVGKECG